MDKFLELSFRNHYLQNEEIAGEYEELLKPLIQFVEERLSKQACDDFYDIFMDCATDAFTYAGVAGMELAIGVMNGTIQQVL